MIHQRQRLSLGLKACNHTFVSIRLYDLQRDAPADRLSCSQKLPHPPSPICRNNL
jgi:hypothetical protein